MGSECIVEDNHHTGLGGQGGRGEDGEEDEEEDQPLGREETLSKDSAIDNRYDSDELSPTGQKDKLICSRMNSFLPESRYNYLKAFLTLLPHSIVNFVTNLVK